MENKNSRLENRDYVLIIDKSGSMDTEDCAGGQSRWDASKEGTLQIAQKLSKFDPDGINVYTFDQGYKAFENTTPATVENIFKEVHPSGGTALVPVLSKVFADYAATKKAGKTKANGQIVLVVTDGQPTDQSAVAKLISDFTQTLDNGDGEFGISFIQVGKDAQASAFLKKLDDDLVGAGAKFDIVDTKTMDELGNMSIADALIAALDD